MISFRPANLNGFQPRTYVLGWNVDGGFQEVLPSGSNAEEARVEITRDRSLSDLGFSVRARNLLENVRITTSNELLDTKVSTVLGKGCGKTTSDEIFSILRSKIGLELKKPYKSMTFKNLREVESHFKDILKKVEA